MTEPLTVESYSALAPIYDEVMMHVDYHAWAIYISELIHEFCPGGSTMLELGCGTGSLALFLTDLVDLQYAGFDSSEAMIHQARLKSETRTDPTDVQFYVDDFLGFSCRSSFDVGLLLYDGLNYLQHPADVVTLLENSRRCMHPDSILIFDVSTPANSIKNAEYFEDYGKGDDFSYYRTSEYDREARLHRTTFQVTTDEGVFVEEHVQRAFSRAEVLDFVDQADLVCLAALDDFSTLDADDNSERIHFVVRRKQ
ncbi:MAG: class I SAM-dependent methyltransferase [Rhodothermales bacterium]|nr:class I SAM-dependent methyltransferase [Rhodothermales bacterium]